MKKIVSVLLAVVLAVSSVITVLAGVNVEETKSQIPVIRISGDGEALYDAEGNKIFHYKDVAKLVKGDGENDNSEMYKSMAEAILPALAKGMATNNWDDLYEGLETEISKIFANSLLDENGNVTNNSGLSEKRKQQMQDKRTKSQKGNKGYQGNERHAENAEKFYGICP